MAFVAHKPAGHPEFRGTVITLKTVGWEIFRELGFFHGYIGYKMLQVKKIFVAGKTFLNVCCPPTASQAMLSQRAIL